MNINNKSDKTIIRRIGKTKKVMEILISVTFFTTFIVFLVKKGYNNLSLV